MEAFVDLVKNKWTSVKNWIGNIPIVEQGVKLVKEKWSTVKEWIGNIPTLSQYIQLLKEKWTTVKEWVGNIPVLSQFIKLAKDRWDSVKNWIGNIPTLPQYIQLLKERWTSVKNWIGNIPVLSQYIALAKHLWTTVRNWIGNIPVLSQGISLLKSGWSYVSTWVRNFLGGTVSEGITLAQSGWSTVANWVRSKLGGAVSVTVSLVQGWVGSLKKWLGFEGGGIIGANGGLKMYAVGGTIDRNGRSWWDSVPKYAKGTPSAGDHGSLFVAGENGAELVGHVNGTTEVLNRFQLAQVMRSSIVSGMSQFTGYWRTMNSQMVVCSNAIIRSILVSSDVMNASLATVGGSYDPTNALAQSVYEDSQRAYNNSYSEESLSRAMREFYQEYVEPSVNRMIAGIEKQADKEEQTIVQVGNRTISDAVVTQQKANGYVFAK